MVTCTDMGILAGNHPEACWAKILAVLAVKLCLLCGDVMQLPHQCGPCSSACLGSLLCRFLHARQRCLSVLQAAAGLRDFGAVACDLTADSLEIFVTALR